MIKIIVTDSGHGVKESLRDKILEPFFTTKEVGFGTGLGLSTAKGLIENHSGSLTFDKKSTNTRFIITLPKKQHKDKLAS